MSYLRGVLSKMRPIFPRINGLLSSYMPQILLQIQVCSALNLSHHCQEICQSSCPAHCCASQHVSTMEQSQSTQELCPTICSSHCLLSCPFFVVRCLRQSQAHVQPVALWAAFCHANNIVVKSANPPNFSTQSPAICPSQCAIHCEDIRPVHCHPASSEKSSFLTIFNTNRKRPAKFFARRTVHTVGPSLLHGATKSLHIYLKPRNKHHRLEGLLRFKKLTISRKLYIVSKSRLISSQEERCLYVSARKKA